MYYNIIVRRNAKAIVLISVVKYNRNIFYIKCEVNNMEITMLIVSIVTLVVTGCATIISAFQLKKLNDEKKNVNINIRKLYVQKIRINKKYIEDNVRRFENTIERLTFGKEDRENYLKNIECLSYYITSINNKKFEEI